MKSEIARLGNNEVEYAFSRGKPDTVVLINGAGGPLIGWFGVFEPLCAHFNVLAYNRPGVGKSTRAQVPQTAIRMASDLESLMAHLGIEEKVILVGHSLGGLIALQFGLDFPQRVKRLILLEPSTVWDIMNQNKLPRDNKDINSELNFVVESARSLEDLSDFPLLKTIICSGTKNSILSWLFRRQFAERKENLKKLSQSLKGSELIEFTKSGHFPQITEPKKVVEMIVAARIQP